MGKAVQPAGLYTIGAMIALTMIGSTAYAQDATKGSDDSKSGDTISVMPEQDAAARQALTKRLRLLGVNLNWHRATLAELKRTLADLVAAGDDEDLRLRVILAARLRELGVRVNWHTLTADELTDRYTAALQKSNKKERIAEAPTDPAEETAGKDTSANRDTAYVDAPVLPRVQPAQELSAEEEEALALANQTPSNTFIIEPVPIIIDAGYGVDYAPNYLYSPTIVTRGRGYYYNGSRDYYYRHTQPSQSGLPIGPRLPQPIVSMPGGRPGVPGVIPIQNPKIPWLNGNR